MWGRMNIIIKPWYEQQVFFNRTDLNRRDVELGSAPNKIPNPNPGDHAKRCFDFKIRKFITKSSNKSCCSFFDPMIYVICSSEFPPMRIEHRNINKNIHHRQVLFAMKSRFGKPVRPGLPLAGDARCLADSRPGGTFAWRLGTRRRGWDMEGWTARGDFFSFKQQNVGILI